MFSAIGQVCTLPARLIEAVRGFRQRTCLCRDVYRGIGGQRRTLGLPRAKTAEELAAQTLLGTAKMAMESGKHPGALKDMVCSPGGTTIRAVRALEKGGFRASIIDAACAAYEKSLEMKREAEKDL